MRSTSLLLASIATIFLTACGGSSSGGDDSKPAKAVLTLAPASIELIAESNTPVTLTVANTSTSITAHSVKALLPSSWTDVVQDSAACASLPPQAHCVLSFTPGAASHALASVNISGSNTETASADIVVSPFNGAVIAPLTATQVSMDVNTTVSMVVVNNSATTTAVNISARLDGTALAGNVTQDTSDCVSVLPGTTCTLTLSALNTPVSATSFAIRGDNTTAIGGSIAITLSSSAQLGVAGSPLVLRATVGAATAGVVTITNLSSDITATNVVADLVGTALDGNVTQDASNCATLAPAQSCTLSFTPGSTAVAQATFTIRGDNTSQVGASIAIDAPQATLTVTGSPLTLFINGVSGSVVVTNTSNDLATNIASNFTGTALDGNVAETSSPCAILASHQSCNLTFTPGSAAVSSTSFAIAGSNTNTVLASMTIQAVGVGDLFGGGRVMVLPVGNAPGLIVATSGTTSEWGGFGSALNVMDNNEGATNTASIVTALGNNGGIPYAAGYCDALVDGAYSDWFLPARFQLGAVMDAAAGLVPDPGLFDGQYYWSSTESNFDTTLDAWMRSSAGVDLPITKNTVLDVRCVREFTL